MNFLLRFLPPEKRAMIELVMRITSALDTAEERKAAIDYGIEMLSDGTVSVTEWAKFGKVIGVTTGKH